MISEFDPGAHTDLLRDESRRSGSAGCVAFAADEPGVVDVLRELGGRVSVTVQGARTGIVAGAVPEGGAVLNLSRMNRVLGFGSSGRDGARTVRVQPGVSLDELRTVVAAQGGWFYAPDPTETSASVGGMVACNASGARTLRYGATRGYVESLRIVLVSGETLSLRRGRERAAGRAFELRTEQGRVLRGELPQYRCPAVKCAAGYYAADDMDMIDLFIGMEGTLGVVTEAELRLLPLPAAIWGLGGGATRPRLRGWGRRARRRPWSGSTATRSRCCPRSANRTRRSPNSPRFLRKATRPCMLSITTPTKKR